MNLFYNIVYIILIIKIVDLLLDKYLGTDKVNDEFSSLLILVKKQLLR